MERANIERLNELTALSRVRALTHEEQKERAERRKAYLEAFKSRLRVQLDNTVVEYSDGSRKTFKEAGSNQSSQTGGNNNE